MSWFSSAFDSVGDLFSSAGSSIGNMAGSALTSYMNKQNAEALMDKSNFMNIQNWEKFLAEAPSRQVQGLKDAGLNPLLAVGGYDYPQGIGNVSAMSAQAGDLSDLGTSAFKAMRDYSDSKVNANRNKQIVQDTKVKKAAKENLEADKDLKEAQAKKTEAEATKTKVDTFTDPAKVVTSAIGAVATAYGAKKAIEVMKNRSKKSPKISADEYRKGLEKVFRRSPSIGSKVLQSAGLVGALALPAYGAYQLNKKLDKVSPSARKILQTPNLGSRLR